MHLLVPSVFPRGAVVFSLSGFVFGMFSVTRLILVHVFVVVSVPGFCAKLYHVFVVVSTILLSRTQICGDSASSILNTFLCVFSLSCFLVDSFVVLSGQGLFPFVLVHCDVLVHVFVGAVRILISRPRFCNTILDHLLFGVLMSSSS